MSERVRQEAQRLIGGLVRRGWEVSWPEATVILAERDGVVRRYEYRGGQFCLIKGDDVRKGPD
jgi:hypothetical protein